MYEQVHAVVDGYVDAEPCPGTLWGTALFDLIPQPADDNADASDNTNPAITCTTGDPRIAQFLLAEVRAGDLVRITGSLIRFEDAASRFTVDALDVLAPLPMWEDMALHHCGTYRVITSPGEGGAVFTEDGSWIGQSATLEGVSDLIADHENGRSSR